MSENKKQPFSRPALIFIVCAALLAVLIAAIFYFTGQQTEEIPPLADSDQFLVCIDAGHGGSDPGATNGDETRFEKDDNLALALAVREILLQNDIEVIMTRESDIALTLDERCQIANDSGAELFVSLHRNSGGGTGVEVWITSEPGSIEKSLGKAVIDRLAAAGVNNNRGVRRGTANNTNADYAVNRGTSMPSCIVEVGFIDSGSDNDIFDINLQAYAQAIAEGILSMYR